MSEFVGDINQIYDEFIGRKKFQEGGAEYASTSSVSSASESASTSNWQNSTLSINLSIGTNKTFYYRDLIGFNLIREMTHDYDIEENETISFPIPQTADNPKFEMKHFIHLVDINKEILKIDSIKSVLNEEGNESIQNIWGNDDLKLNEKLHISKPIKSNIELSGIPKAINEYLNQLKSNKSDSEYYELLRILLKSVNILDNKIIQNILSAKIASLITGQDIETIKDILGVSNTTSSSASSILEMSSQRTTTLESKEEEADKQINGLQNRIDELNNMLINESGLSEEEKREYLREKLSLESSLKKLIN